MSLNSTWLIGLRLVHRRFPGGGVRSEKYDLV
jgi:hypothetical protein